MSPKRKIQYVLLKLIGLAAVLAFGAYWFTPQNVGNNFHGGLYAVNVLLYLCVSFIIWLPIAMKVLVWTLASYIRPKTAPRPPDDLRVAFITTFVPASEPISLLKQTLAGMVAAKYPHDTWLLDEGNDPQAKQLCAALGVKYFSRSGKPHYNKPSGKFAARTKGGNHNSWYDHVGHKYDFVAQIDTDFTPNEFFLLKTLGYFNNPKVAFVGTPQIYGNIHDSIIARGAAEQTYAFYGPFLRGLDGMNSTLLIGANHVIRVKALESVDYYGAHITEDLMTGMKLHSKGWTSLYVPEALAVGEGPTTWKAYFNQQHRWAYGCMHILFNYSFNYMRSMSMRQRMYYFWIQQYYFTGVALLLGVICLNVYFLTGIQSARVDLTTFLIVYGGLWLIVGVVDMWLQRLNVRPSKEKGLMWAAMLIGVAAQPIYLAAFLRLFRRNDLTFKVTPKGKRARKDSRKLNIFAPHLTIGAILILDLTSTYFTHRTSTLMIFWAIVSGSSLLLIPCSEPLIRFFTRDYPPSIAPVTQPPMVTQSRSYS